MNAKNFSQYLQDTAMLHQQSFEQLKTMSLQYPYCQALRLLLLRKAILEQRPNWERLLAQTAVATVDRSLLYEEVKALGADEALVDNFVLADEYLELRSIEPEAEEAFILPEPEDWEAKIPAPPPSEAPLPFAANGQPEPGTLPQSDREPPFAEEQLSTAEWAREQLHFLEEQLPGQAPSETVQPIWHYSLVADAAALDAITNRWFSERHSDRESPAKQSQRMPVNSPLHRPMPKPRPKTSFTSWVAQFQAPDIQQQLAELMEADKLDAGRSAKRKKQKKQKTFDDIAARSIAESDDIASETLAKILARQGQTDKACEMYRRLMLVFPEKKAYFAEQIENLKIE